MKKYILDFLCKLEGYKTAIKQLHWNADNMSQHKLCDEIADEISSFQDTVSEVEQSLSGPLPLNKLKGTPYRITTLKKFVNDVIRSTKSFYAKLKKEGDNYIGMRSDVEAFLSTIQRKLYLVDFTIKEDMRRRISKRLNENRVVMSNGVERYRMSESEARKLVNEAIRNVLGRKLYESMPKNAQKADQIDKLIGRRPTTIKSRINQIYKLVKKYGLERQYSDNNWQALEDYRKVISSYADGFEVYGGSDGGSDSKQWNVRISFDDGMEIDGYIRAVAEGTAKRPFSSYTMNMILWPKEKTKFQGTEDEMQISESQIRYIVSDVINRLGVR